MRRAEAPVDRLFTQMTFVEIQCDERGIITCEHCDKPLVGTEIAFVTRTVPNGPFTAWCAQCALTFSQWALQGALFAGIDDGPDDVA